MSPAGRRCAVHRATERARFMRDNGVAMSDYGQLLTEKIPESQGADFLRQAGVPLLLILF